MLQPMLQRSLTICRDFIPDSGRLLHLQTPPISDTVRVDAGFTAGDEVSSHYDPMIAKLIVQGPDRIAAVQKMVAALEQYEIVGPTTNIEFLKRVCKHDDFIAGNVETGFIPKNREKLFVETPIAPEVFAQAALGVILQETISLQNCFTYGHEQAGYVTSFQDRILRFTSGTKEPIETEIEVQQIGEGLFDIVVGESTYRSIRSHWDSETKMLTSFFPHARLQTRLIVDEGKITLFQQGTQYRLNYAIPKWMEKALGVKDITNSVLAPMPCKILRVEVNEGDSVKKDQALVVIESMKMETVIRSPHDGIVAKIAHKQGVSALPAVEASLEIEIAYPPLGSM